MHSWDALPQKSLIVTGSISAEMLAYGIHDFREAGRYLHALPYGRTTPREDFLAVLREGRGTCSTKHALLAALARELALPVLLTLGLYEMHERNTPGVGAVLSQYGLRSLPEAHCYLKYNGQRVDVTRSRVEPTEPITQFLYEGTIAPEQIGEYKINLHRRVMQDWVVKNPALVQGLSFEEIWQIRESCILALVQ